MLMMMTFSLLASKVSFGRGSTSFALSKQAMPAFILYSFYCAGRTCEDNSNEVEPRPNKGVILFASA
ncbi:MAG: hypothetical protein LBG80_01145 [Bacteroidales bacterium]|nr:hypothetical protein [Bacteroidales bacterium]